MAYYFFFFLPPVQILIKMLPLVNLSRNALKCMLMFFFCLFLYLNVRMFVWFLVFFPLWFVLVCTVVLYFPLKFPIIWFDQSYVNLWINCCFKEGFNWMLVADAVPTLFVVSAAVVFMLTGEVKECWKSHPLSGFCLPLRVRLKMWQLNWITMKFQCWIWHLAHFHSDFPSAFKSVHFSVNPDLSIGLS